MTEAELLTREGAVLTRRMSRSQERHETNARRRAEVWEAALSLGVSQHALARAAGVHHSQVAKAIERYRRNGQ